MIRSFSSVKGSFKQATHVIFDMDGLLLDTEKLYTEAIQNVVSQYGKNYTWEFKCQLMGMWADDAAKMIIKTLDLPISLQEYTEQINKQYKELMPTTQLMPDTEWVYYKVISSLTAQFGKIYSSNLRAKVLGTQQADTCKIVVQELKLPLPWEEFAEQFSTESKKLIQNCSFLQGAELLVTHLHRNNIPIALATSSSQESFELKTRKHQQFFKLFNHIVTGASDPEVKNGKPSPDIFLVCASRFLDKPSNESCLVFEDAPNGVKAAISAGMQCVMVPDKLMTEEHRKEATLIVKTLQEFKPELFGLPKMN